MTITPIIMWFRKDLRISDNPAPYHASKVAPIIPLYILENSGAGFVAGSAQDWWLHHSLVALKATLESKGLDLILRQGSPLEIIANLVDLFNPQAVYWNRRYEPDAIKTDRALKLYLKEWNVEIRSFNSSLLFEA